MIVGRQERVLGHLPQAVSKILVCAECKRNLKVVPVDEGWSVECRNDSTHQGATYPEHPQIVDENEERRLELLNVAMSDPAAASLIRERVKQLTDTLFPED